MKKHSAFIVALPFLKLKYFFLYVAIVLAGLAACSKKSNVPAVTPPVVLPPIVIADKFQVKESQILDNAGKEFIAKGVNVNGPLWPWSRPTIPDINLIADIWKCNIVRVNCWPQNTPYVNTNNDNLDGIVKGFTDRKVVVLLENHSFTGRYPNATELATSVAWWTALANKYKSNTYVWFNLFNEPGSAGSAVTPIWLEVHETIIKAIRAAGADNIIVCDEHGYGQANGFDKASSSAALTYGETITSNYRNVVFSLHTYELWIYGQQRLESYVNLVKAKNLALIIGEYGVGANFSMAVASDVFSVCIPNKIGRIAWHWVGEDIYKLTTTGTGGGYEIDNTAGTKPGNLSFGGNLVWMDNHGLLQPGDAALRPPAILISNANFESGNPASGSAQITDWINFGTAQLDNTPANVKEGNFSMKVKEEAAGGLGQAIYLQPNTTYKITAWGKYSAVASLPATIGLKYTVTYNGAEISLASLDFTESSFIEKSATFTTPATLASMFIFIYKNDASPAFWCDDIRIVKQ